mmetsp:Transcript_4831/g.4081  ORF Transcript_4831/g.4081 Transcript_4831/m.4081 type:complete len:115 (+) Transcript_4831:131-475(+)
MIIIINKSVSKKHDFRFDSPFVVDNLGEGSNEQDDAKIIETEEAEENNMFMHKPKEISSIDITNTIGEISDFNSEENYMIQTNILTEKKPSFVTDSDISSSGKKNLPKFKKRSK